MSSVGEAYRSLSIGGVEADILPISFSALDSSWIPPKREVTSSEANECTFPTFNVAMVWNLGLKSMPARLPDIASRHHTRRSLHTFQWV